jgi:flagellar hook assembly protein FlgD
VYDVAGRQVRKLVASPQAAGVHTVAWDGTDSAGTRMPRGVYLVKATVGGQVATRRVIYLAR